MRRLAPCALSSAASACATSPQHIARSQGSCTSSCASRSRAMSLPSRAAAAAGGSPSPEQLETCSRCRLPLLGPAASCARARRLSGHLGVRAVVQGGQPAGLPDVRQQGRRAERAVLQPQLLQGG